MTDSAEQLRAANRRLRARLVASAHLLDTPFTDEPSLSPWELIKRDLATLDEAIKVALGAALATDVCLDCGAVGHGNIECATCVRSWPIAEESKAALLAAIEARPS